ncbi:phosphorylase family protein, partial [Yinghuangia sp. YIM S09857]|uniref:phosphorylase family protein n=1 Tax=Yinghuangia sp. YIM S09857 TaxID=3436929 RepID=UPI003F52AD52
ASPTGDGTGQTAGRSTGRNADRGTGDATGHPAGSGPIEASETPDSPATPLLVAPLRIERRALVRGGAPAVVRSGMGEAKSLAYAERLAAAPAALVAGMGAGMHGLRPGDIVVATEVRGPDGEVRPCPWADELVKALRPLPVPVYAGPVATVRKLVRPAERGPLAEAGVVAADMESSFLLALRWAGAGPERPWAVVRVVSDSPGHELLRPGIVRNGLAAYRSLKAAASTLSAWLGAVAGPDSAPFPAAGAREGADLGVGRGTADEQDGGG